MATRALLIGNSRWHWAHWHEGRWCFHHDEPDPQRIDTANLVWAAVGEVPAALESAQDSRLNCTMFPCKAARPGLGSIGRSGPGLPGDVNNPKVVISIRVCCWPMPALFSA